MEITFDPAKSEANALARGLPFTMAARFDFATALVVQDVRRVYPEVRFQALGRVGVRLFALVYTPTPDGIRVISFRKANDREVRRYEQARS